MSTPRVQRCTIARNSGWLSRRVELPDVLGGPRPHDGKERVDRVEDARDPAKRQRRGAEAGNFPVTRISKGPDAVHGIARRLLAVVVAVEGVEGRGEELGSGSRL